MRIENAKMWVIKWERVEMLRERERERESIVTAKPMGAYLPILLSRTHGRNISLKTFFLKKNEITDYFYVMG